MSRTIEKKIWPEFFQRILTGEKNYEIRLANFDVLDGDILRLKEWNPKTEEYTGRELERKVKKVVTISSPTRFYTKEQIEKYGLYVIELES